MVHVPGFSAKSSIVAGAVCLLAQTSIASAGSYSIIHAFAGGNEGRVLPET